MIRAVLRHAGLSARLLTLACAIAGVGTAGGQSSTAPAAPSSTGASAAPSRFGVIAGIVVDSLHGGPLRGAQISVEGLNTLAMTDSTGRFRIDSVPPGKYRVGVFHPLLDSLALSIASPPLQVSADSTLAVIFATPSTLTFIRLVCGTIQIDTMAGIGPSVVVGRVLDAETEAPVGGVKVTLDWTEIQAGAKIGVHRIQRMRDTTTGPSGEFRFCHLPPGLNGVARAAIATADSGAVSRPLALNGRLVVPIVLHVPGAAKPATSGGTNSTHGTASSNGSSPSAGASVLTGRVMRAEGAGPLAGAQVTVLGSREITVTNDSGEFTLRGLPAGSRTLAARAIGWRPEIMAVDLAAHAPQHVVVPLQTKTAELQAVVVTGTINAGLKRVGFESRKHTGVGHFLGPDDIEKRNAFEFADMMDGMAGLARYPGPYGDEYLTGPSGPSGCVAYIVDGAPYVEMTRGDINTFVRPQEVGAIEVYQPGEAPAEYGNGPRQTPNIAIMVQVPQGGTRSAMADSANSALSEALPLNISSTGTRVSGSGCVKIVVWTKIRLGIA